MYVIRLTCVTIATVMPVNTLTLCYSIWAADPNTTVTKCGCKLTLLTLCEAIACKCGNVLRSRYHTSFPLLT